MAEQTKIGILGGSGFYKLEALENPEEIEVDTEFGKPSDKIVKGKISGVECYVLARHGRDHSVNPTNVNYRANVRALQKCGVTHILAATACGSLKEEFAPGDFAVLGSFIDRTTKRHQTFHDGNGKFGGSVCHIPMSPAFCARTSKIVVEACKNLDLKVHSNAVMVTIEGPRFSSKAESLAFKSWGADVINMTTVPEVVLAAEAGISYVSVAMVTDYDCWRENEEAVSVEKVLAVLRNNVDKVKNLFVKVVGEVAKEDWTDVVKANQMKASSSVMH